MSETNYAVAPGEYLLEWMEENDKNSQAYISQKLGWSHNDLDLFLAGKMRITHMDSFRLRGLTGIPSRTWMNHEMQYNKDLVRLWEND